MSAQLTWRALDEAGEARTAANRPAFLPQTLAFLGQPFFWPRNLPQEHTIPWNRRRKRRFLFNAAVLRFLTQDGVK